MMGDQPTKPISPISQVLQSIGLTREDLMRHSDQMRQFLTTEDAKSLRAFSAESSDTHHPIASALGVKRNRSVSNSKTRPSASHHHSASPQPPATPIKSEPSDTVMPLRHMDSMEMILERKSRQAKRDKRTRKEKDRSAPSPSPSGPSFSLDSFMQSRDLQRVSSSEQEDTSRSATPQEAMPDIPTTPQRRKYYRDYDNYDPSSARRQTTYSPRPELHTPTRPRTRSTPMAAPQDVFVAQNSESPDPVTPRKNYYRSPLPASSPPQSSPFATPSKPIVNLVSSPGPMGPLPDEDDYDKLPYKLPPGPYATAKPDLSYAALIGQAILSSPEHRLTLQEIYDWITIVYPYFKRQDTTWMNSIRHVLSTTVCFRKVPRDRSVGRTLWAIWDCDLKCFENGGFKKEFCSEMKSSDKKIAPKKRPAEDSGGGRKSKKAKKSAASASTSIPAQFQASMLPPLVPTSHLLPLFPPRHGANHQPYYAHHTQLPAEVIFPPLPATSGYHQAQLAASRASSSAIPSDSTAAATAHDSEALPTSPAIPSSSRPPELSPTRSSSPQMPSEALTQTDTSESYPHVVITPVLESRTAVAEHEVTEQPFRAKLQHHKTPSKKPILLPFEPISPSLERRSKAKRIFSKEASPPMLMWPSTPERPSTPPRNAKNSNILQLSPTRTPLSHKGLHMSPSASLAYYKSHLDPPPSAGYKPDDGINPAVLGYENMRTPPRKRHTGHHKDRDKTKELPSIFPSTPKRLVYPSASAESPFRTPGARSIFDPHDAGTLLDEEFAHFGSRSNQESPEGLFGSRRSLLYESPSLPSPGKLARWL